MKYPTPSKPGHFWAKWQIASEATKEGDELTPSPNFEVVQVVENSIDRNDPEHLLVYVPGVEAGQALDAFFWREEVLPLLAPDRAKPGTGGEKRKSHYGDGEQPWDTILASGWGPAFAAGCVVRYLRRDKAREHSLESARWYYARLVEGVADEAKGKFPKKQESALHNTLRGCVNSIPKSTGRKLKKTKDEKRGLVYNLV